MKKILFVFFFLYSYCLIAQDHKWEVGFALNIDKTFFRFKGLNFSPINEQRLIAFNKDTDSAKIALNPSINVAYLFAESWAVESGVGFLDLGIATKFGPWWWPAPPPNSFVSFLSRLPDPLYNKQIFRMYYISIPLLIRKDFKIKDKYSLSISIGGATNISVGNYTKTYEWGESGDTYVGVGKDLAMDKIIYSGLTNFKLGIPIKNNYNLYLGTRFLYTSPQTTNPKLGRPVTQLHITKYTYGLTLGILKKFKIKKE